MVLSIAYEIFNKFSSGFVPDDDSSDRLSYRVTTMILIVSALLIGTKQLVGEPISCWIPAHFTGNHEEYTNSYCWVRNTYYLPWDEHVPKEHEHEKRQMIYYYQWISIILLLQALFFYLPRLFWVGLKARVGVDVTTLMMDAKKLQNCMESESHESTLSNMANHMHRMLKRPRATSKVTASFKSIISRTCCRCIGRSRGNYLISVFLLTKMLFIGNILGQLFVLNSILGFKFNMFGIEVIDSLAHQREWVNTPFPRVTMCDMKIRRLGNVHRYAVQCVLPINLFTEKLYLFQWFWYVILLCLSVLEFVQWTARIMFWRKQRYAYIEKHLELAKENFDERKKMILDHVDEFADLYLKQDGVFILRLIAKNSTQAIATMLTKALWDEFEPWWKEREQEKPWTEVDTMPKKKPPPEYEDSTLPSKSRLH